MVSVLFGFKDEEVDVRCVRRRINLWSKQVYGFFTYCKHIRMIIYAWLEVVGGYGVPKFFSSFDS